MALLTLNGQKELERLIATPDKLGKAIIPKATSMAINKTITSMKSEAKTLIKNETGIKAGKVNKALITTRSTVKTLSAKLDASRGRATNLADFLTDKQLATTSRLSRQKFKGGKNKGKAKRQGVRARAWGVTKTYKGAFIGKGKVSGKTLVFRRTGSGRESELEGLAGPSIRYTFKSKGIQSKLKDKAHISFDKEFSRAFTHLLRKQTTAR